MLTLSVFESSIGRATDKETDLFQKFDEASSAASAWLTHHRASNRLFRMLDIDQEKLATMEKPTPEDAERAPLFVDTLLDIGQETELLKEIKDIRDELNMISKVLEDQKHVLPDLGSAISEIYFDERKSQQEMKKRFENQLKMIDMHLHDIQRMDKQAERIYKSITDMLDLKQKHANAFEARFARDQAAGTNRQSQTVMVFTLVTIVFLPLSFIAAFFTINIQEFPGQASSSNGGAPGLPLAYVSKYMFGIGFAISIPLILIALSLEDISAVYTWLRRRIAQRRKRKVDEKTHALDMLRMQRTASDARTRYTVDDDWATIEMGRIQNSCDVPRRSKESDGRTTRTIHTGFRMRPSQDVERLPT